MARIRRAQAKGKKDVKLSKEELAAYQRRLQRMEDEGRRQRREQRVAIPISQLDRPRQKRLSIEDDNPSRRPSPSPEGEERQTTYSPMGYFPPPSSRSRPRSGTTSSRPPSRAATDREQSSSPFTYTYVRAEQPAIPRHPSDPITGRPLSVADPVSARNGGSPASVAGHAQAPADPFQYITGGTRPSYHTAGPVRNSIIEVDDIYASYGADPAGGASRRRSSGDSRDDASPRDDDRGHGARVVSGSGSRSRHRESVDSRREPAPEPRPSREKTPPLAKKSSAVPSPAAKRKSVSGSTKSSGRRKVK